MKSLILCTLIALSVSSCASYTSVTKVGKGTVAVTKNDGLLWGLLRGPQVYICKATPSGLTNCATSENP